MELTEAELAEGRRLLEESRKQQAIDRMGIAATVWNCWVSDHADALLARPEEIAREAVREFAEAIVSHHHKECLRFFSQAGAQSNAEAVLPLIKTGNAWSAARDVVRDLAAARGVTLDDGDK